MLVPLCRVREVEKHYEFVLLVCDEQAAVMTKVLEQLLCSGMNKQ
jgi:hypothetical protein